MIDNYEINIIKKHIHYEVELPKSILMDNNPIISYTYNKTLKPVVSEIKKLHYNYSKLIIIIELLEYHNKLDKLYINKVKYICIYNKLINIMRLNNENTNKNVIIIVDIIPLIYDLEEYKQKNIVLVLLLCCIICYIIFLF